MRVSPFQMYENDDIAGLVTKTHLGYRFGIEPQQASKVATMIHAANSGATVASYLNRFPTLYLDSDEEFTWDLISNGKKNIPLVKASLTSGGSAVLASDRVGENLTEFYLTFPEAHFTDVNQIVGERNEVYPILILDEPRPVGAYWEYRCRLNTGQKTLFIPFEELQTGKRFSKDFSPVEDTLSKKGGGVNYSFPFKMKNSFTMIRMEDTIPGNMIKRPVKFSWVGEEGQLMTTWMDYRTYRLEMAYQDEIAKMFMYATSNQSANGEYLIKGKSGYSIKMGAGIKQQMEASNFYTYSTFNIQKFTEMLLDLTVGKVKQAQREITISTGEWGMYEFSKALEYHSTLYTPSRETSRISMGADGKMSYKGQFLEYWGPNGIKVNIIHDSLKDDFERNKLRMPGKPGLAESYVYDILGMSTSDGKPNVQKVMVKGQGDIRGFEPGLRHPFTTDNKQHIMSTAVDGWKEHRAFIGGAIVYDPTRTATYKPNILA
jgi:hypothetical protein